MRNDKSSPREDEQRKHELQGFIQGAPVARRDDQRLQEEILPLQPARGDLSAEPVGGEPSIDEITLRTEFARWLVPSQLPAPAAELLATAEAEGAPEWVCEALARLDPAHLYDTIGAAWTAVRDGILPTAG